MKSNRRTLLCLAVAMVASSALCAESTNPIAELTADRIAQIAAWLPGKPTGFGRPIEDRAYWSDPAIVARTSTMVRQAEKLLGQEFPAWDNEAYLDYSVTGSRTRGLKMQGERESWLKPLVLAECRENKGRFLPLINRILESYASQPTWTWAFHDNKLRNFHGEEYDVDLNSATFGHELAETLYLLDDKIDPSVRKHLEEALRQRIFEPFRRALSSGHGCWWLGSLQRPVQNNWNCVCLAGVVGAALAVIPDKMERALYAAAGEHYTQYYLNSIPLDGYCGEGVGYWNYGFGHLALLREELVQESVGRLDLFANPRIADNALYATRILIGTEAAPPFADCGFDAKPNQELISYCNTVMKLGMDMPPFDGIRKGNLVETLSTASPCDMTAGQPIKGDPLRFYFDKAGVLACRPVPWVGKLGIGIKAGGNGSHSHNDIGSYVIAVGNDKPTGDPGGAVYDSSTFSPQRYEHSILNSYGHPVPVIAGKLQVLAAKANPSVLSTSFTAERDEITMDITSAYDVATLQKLTRHMVYSRSGKGEIRITDEANFLESTTFEDALITRGDWKQTDARTIQLSRGQATLSVTIDSSDPFHFQPKKIKDQGVEFTRIGLVFEKPVKAARVTMTFQPN
jgi:hypothetical protein